MGWKRRAGVAMVLGTFTTVGVAWWPGVHEQLFPRAVPIANAAFVAVARGSSWMWGASRTTEPLYTRANLFWILAYDRGSDPPEERAKFDVLSQELKSDVRELPFGKISSYEQFQAWGCESKQHPFWFAAGWPMRAFCYRGTFDSDEAKRFSYPGGIVLARSGLRGQMYQVSPGSFTSVRPALILPFKPLWPGFAVNTLLGALLWWVPIAGLQTFVSFRRRRRGRCSRCGYDRAGIPPQAPCPECGTNGPAPITATAHVPSARAEGSPGSSNVRRGWVPRV